MSVTTTCPLCQYTWQHDSSASLHGHYPLQCQRQTCNQIFLRCSSCSYVTPRRRKYLMDQHQKSHETSGQKISDTSSLDIHDHDHEGLFTEDVSFEYSSNSITRIIRSRPDLTTLLQDHITNETIDDGDTTVIDELANLIEITTYENSSNTTEQNLDYVVPNCSIDACSDDNNVHGTVTSKLSISDFEYMNGIHNRVYFMQQHNEPHGGIRGIVKRAATLRNNLSDFACLDDADLLFDMTDHLVNLSQADQDKYLQINRKLLKKKNSHLDCQISIPIDRSSANQICLKNKKSIFTNLPSERTFILDGHACISLNDKLDIVFAKGIELSFMQDHTGKRNFDGFNGTVRANELYDEMMNSILFGNKCSTCCEHLMFWSDDFQKCFPRIRENSIWLFVVRICPPDGFSTSDKHTFCLAFGSSKLNHDKVIEYYLKEVNEVLMRGQMRYYGKLGVRRKVNTCFGLALYAADTPERNKIIHRLHLGLYGKRSLHAGKIDPKKLPACNQCFWRMVKETFSSDGIENNCQMEGLSILQIRSRYSQTINGSKK